MVEMPELENPSTVEPARLFWEDGGETFVAFDDDDSEAWIRSDTVFDLGEIR